MVASVAQPVVAEAVIEQARRRTRRRRFMYAAAAALAVGAGVAAAATLLASGGGTPPAGGGERPVKRAIVESTWRSGPRTLELQTGVITPARVVREVFWDRSSGLARVITRIDGRVQSDATGQMCGLVEGPNGRHRLCFAPPPFYFTEGLRSPRRFPARSHKGTFHGRRVLWTGDPFLAGEVGIDPKTKRPVVARSSFRDGTRISQHVFTYLAPTTPAQAVLHGNTRPTRTSFSSYPPLPHALTHARPASLTQARRALGERAVWLGQSFDGRRLRGTEIGNTRSGHGRETRFVRFDYGAFTLKEFGAAHPASFAQAPPRGKAFLFGPGKPHSSEPAYSWW